MVQPATSRLVTYANLPELVQDAVAAMIVQGANITKTYDDAAGTLTIAAAGGNTDVELVRDTIGASLSGTSGVTVTVNDAADTIVLSISGLSISQIGGLQTALDAKVNATRLDYIHAADYGFLPNATAAVNDTAIAAAITAAKTSGLPIFLGIGTIHISAPINCQASTTFGAGLNIYGASKALTNIVQDTDTAELLQVGGFHHSFADFRIGHASATPGNNTGDGIVFYKSAYSSFKRIQIENTGRAIAIPSGDVNEPGQNSGAGNYMFSNTFEDINVLRYSKNGLYLHTTGSTGSTWTNVYINNALIGGGGSLSSTGSPVDIFGVNEQVFNQLNIEDHAGTPTAIAVDGGGSVVMNAVHFERVPLLGFAPQFMRVYGGSQAIINGITLSYADVAPTGTSGAVKCFSVGGQGKIKVDGIYLNFLTKTGSSRFTLVEVDGGSDAQTSADVGYVQLNSSVALSALTDSAGNAGLKRVGDTNYAQNLANDARYNPLTARTKRVTLSLGAPVNNTGASVLNWTNRYVIALPVTPVRWRLRFANVGHNGTVYTMPINVVGIAAGKPVSSGSGRPSSTFTATPTTLFTNLNVPTDGSELVTGWVTDGGSYFAKHVAGMISIGLLTTATGTGVAFPNVTMAYQDSAASASGRYASTSLTAPSGNTSFPDVRLEYEFYGSNPVGAVFGDSIVEGYDADNKPSFVHENWTGAFGLRNDIAWVNGGYYGLGASSFTSPTNRVFSRFDLTTTVPDFAILSVGSNDVGASQSLATIQGSYASMIASVRTLGIQRIYVGTVTPRGFTGTQETTRVQLNAWLTGLPLGVEGCFDFDKMTRQPAAPASMETDAVTADLVHPNHAGHQRMASMVNINVR